MKNIFKWFNSDQNKLKGSFTFFLTILLGFCSFNLYDLLNAIAPRVSFSLVWFGWFAVMVSLFGNFGNILYLFFLRSTRHVRYAILTAIVSLAGSVLLLWTGGAETFKIVFWAGILMVFIYLGLSLKNPYLLAPLKSEAKR